MKEKIAVFVASGFYSGFAKFAPGTFGTLIGSILLLAIWYSGLNIHPWSILLLATSTYFIGWGAINYLPDDWKHDDQRIVIDEIAGIFVAMAFVHINTSTLILSFILFRAFDIFKPLGIRKFDQLKSNQSVMLDDIIAGVYANVTLQILILLLPTL